MMKPDRADLYPDAAYQSEIFCKDSKQGTTSRTRSSLSEPSSIWCKDSESRAQRQIYL